MSQSLLALNEAASPSIFNFGSHAVRIILRDGEPWFVASDVASALGYRDAANAARNLKDHQRGTHNLSTLGGVQKVTIITESGLYKLVLRSRKPEAEEFSDWVTGEVLPSIRKTGGYSKVADQTTAPTMFGRQWLVSTDMNGKETVRPVAPDQFVKSFREIARGIAVGDMELSTAELIDLASACNQRLVHRLGNPALVLAV